MADPSGSPSVVRDADTSVVKGALEAEFTFRAVFVGLSIGVLLAFTNTYFGLQSGWVSMMSLQASLVGFAVFKVLPHSRLFGSRPLTVHENIVLQTTAVATGTLPLAAGLVGIIPALGLLTLDEDGSLPIVLSPWSLIGWCGAVAFFGCFLAVPLRRQVIVKEKLVFPSGTATAQIIGMLHSVPLQRDGPLKAVTSYSALPSSASEAGDDDEDEADESAPEPKLDEGEWSALSWSFSASSIFTILSLMFPVIYAIPIFDVFGYLAHDWLWWFTPSFSYVGQGIIMGFPTTASMNLGMLCGWAFLAPLSKLSGWAPGPVGSTVNGARGWILWPALAIMTAESILSLSLVAVSVFSRRPKTSISSTRERGHSPARPEIKEDEADTCLVIGGVILSCISCVILVSIVFGEDGIKWWATVLALGLASIFSILGVRALGETDLNPVSAIGKISQLLFAIIQPHNIVANLIAGGISEAGAQQAGDLMQDLKTGHLHGASPRAQFYGQLIGSAASVFVSSGIYILYRRVYELPSTSFPVPSAGIWLNLARLVNNGKLPPKTKEAMAIFGVVFIALASLKLLGASRSGPRKLAAYTRFFPSGIGFAVGFINTPSFSIARLIGGLISLYYTRRHARTSSTPATSSSHLENIPLIIVASGFVLGEGLASIVGLVAKSFGAGPLSCFGCHSGGGGYCGGC